MLRVENSSQQENNTNLNLAIVTKSSSGNKLNSYDKRDDKLLKDNNSLTIEANNSSNRRSIYKMKQK